MQKADDGVDETRRTESSGQKRWEDDDDNNSDGNDDEEGKDENETGVPLLSALL